MIRRILISLILIALPAHALAQDALDPAPQEQPHLGPAGNVHPTTAPYAQDVTNPLDSRRRAPTAIAEPAEKHAFSKQVDLSPLRELAVLHNSRPAILDTLARESIRTITGRSRYQDVLVEPGAGDRPRLRKLSYDPLFTYFDLMADFDYYWDKPIVSVEFLPLRQGIVDAEFPNDPQQREKWLMATRLSPKILQHQRDLLARVYMPDLNFERPMRQVNMSAYVMMNTYAGLDLVAPYEPYGDWVHVSQHPQLAPMFSQLGAAWRAMDAEKVNALVREIADVVPTINAEYYPPQWRRSMEHLYNGTNKFVVGYSLYLFALVALLIAFGTGRVGVRWLGVALLLAAITIHAAGFAMRWVLAERIPIQNQFESMLGLCLAAGIFGTILMFVRRQPIFGAAAAGVGFLTLMTATMTGIPGQSIGREAAILNTSYILFYHVNVVLFSYGLIALGFIVSTVYLLMHYLGGRSELTTQVIAAGIKSPGAWASSPYEESPDHSGKAHAPLSESETAGLDLASYGLEAHAPGTPGIRRLLADLDHAQMVILQMAFWILAVGILLGAWWADHSWGRWWAFDPKETWALITWMVYLVVIHIRFVTPARAVVTAWLSIVGFFTMLWTYFGVNLLLPGLHAYA